jgi:hypothetical protein
MKAEETDLKNSDLSLLRAGPVNFPDNLLQKSAVFQLPSAV